MEIKVQEEEHCKSYYIQRSSAQMYGTNKHWYLYCNRSGTIRTTPGYKKIVTAHFVALCVTLVLICILVHA